MGLFQMLIPVTIFDSFLTWSELIKQSYFQKLKFLDIVFKKKKF